MAFSDMRSDVAYSSDSMGTWEKDFLTNVMS
jgi:hypothetical protein